MTNGEACNCECTCGYAYKMTIKGWVAEGGDYEEMYRRAKDSLLFSGGWVDTSPPKVERQMAHIIRNRLW